MSCSSIFSKRFFQDFKVLVKVCLDLDHEERRARLDAYKARFAEYDFDMYLCRYLREKSESPIISLDLLC